STAKADPPVVPKLRPAVAAGRIVATSGRMVTTGSRTAMRAARRPHGRLVLGGFLITALVTAAVLLGVWLVPSGKVPAALEPSPTGSAESVAPTDLGQPSYSPPPSLATSPVAPNAGLTEWADKLAVKVEIPPVALRAYAYAEYVMLNRKPACNLRWSTIAAVGKLESNHGRVGASTLGPDGRALPPIVGPALDGKGGRAKVADTDAGALDNDRAWDHAVGPMQFLPATWRSYAVDADSDGIVDPNDVDDAALAVANKLCESSKDLTQPANWTAAIKTFPDLAGKVQQVFDAANTYGLKSRA
ncbi:MAG: murein transglycosylase, partial [Hamadaea sp.]|nr:murein transglycosylase [Hamadaea sp.]